VETDFATKGGGNVDEGVEGETIDSSSRRLEPDVSQIFDVVGDEVVLVVEAEATS
jgi:hypothetical protein